MKKLLLIITWLWMGVLGGIAQEINYSNIVVSKDGEPVMGATVEVVGTNSKTMTDMDGKFTIVVPKGHTTLMISYGGMKKQVISIVREPILLYRKNTPAVQMKSAGQYTNVVKTRGGRDYKKNIFNLELFYASYQKSAIIDWELKGKERVGLSFGYHHHFTRSFGWKVLDLQGMIAYDGRFEDDVCNGVYSLTTGLNYNTPYFGKYMYAWADFHAGAAYNHSIDEFAPTYGVAVGINLTRTVYLAVRYDWTEYSTYLNSVGDVDVKDNGISFRLGFNFGK